MPDTVPTLLTIARVNGSDAIAGLIDEAARPHPEVVFLPARTIKGQNYKTLVRIAVPRGGAFRDANAGAPLVTNTYVNRLVETFIFNPRWEADKAVADRSEDGAEAFIALEAGGIMEGALSDLCEQFYYGRNAYAAGKTGSVKGFPGLIDVVDAAKVVDAGGTTAVTSVWLVLPGPRRVQWVAGNNGGFQMDNPRIETLYRQVDGANTLQRFTGYVQELLAYPGLQVGSINSVARIKNVGTDAGKGLTDKLLFDLMATFPEGTDFAGSMILMNNRSWTQLRNSRTAVNTTGAEAPLPESIQGPNAQIPIRVTAAIATTETI
jgi:hypothetical protein